MCPETRLLTLMLWLGSCAGGTAEVPRPPHVGSGPVPVRSSPTPQREYVPSDRSLRSQPQLEPDAADGQGGAVVDGVRVDARGGGGEERPLPKLTGGTRVPVRLGGGFLFWSAKALFFAKTVTGRLEPVAALPLETPPNRAAFGPDFVLLHYANGARLAWSLPSRQPSPMPVPGLVDAAALADGRAVLLAHPNRLLARTAATKSWKEWRELRGVVQDLQVIDDALWVRLGDGRALRLEVNGALVEIEPLPLALRRSQPLTVDPRWPTAAGLPRERALKSGILLRNPLALVEVGGAFARVNLETGAVEHWSPAVVASTGECRLLPMDSDVLSICRTSTDGSVVIAGAASDHPRIEQSFPQRTIFYAGAPGTLAARGPCSEPEDVRVVVCVREREGTWRELSYDLRAEAREAGGRGADAAEPKASDIVRWVPTSNGNAIGITGGSHAGLVDARRRTSTPFVAKDRSHYQELLATPSALVNDSLAVLPDGTLVGYLGQRAIRVASDGQLASVPHQFTSLTSAGPWALGVGANQDLWQSTDFGQNWLKIAPPPGFTQGDRPQVLSCSRAGCDLGAWYRLGFPPTPPAPERWPEGPSVIRTPPAPVPRLECEVTGAGEPQVAPLVHDAAGNPLEIHTFGARSVRMRREQEPAIVGYVARFGAIESVRAAMLVDAALQDSNAPGWFALLSRPSSVRYSPLFEQPRVLESSFTWHAIATKVGWGPMRDLDLSGQGQVLPVLTSTPGVSGGLVLVNVPWLLWVREGRPSRAYSLNGEQQEFLPRSVVAGADEELLVLVEDAAGKSRVLSMTAAGSRVLTEMPQRPLAWTSAINPDALAVGVDGTFAVLRTPSLTAPTLDDPALAIAPGRAPLALAPWSTLSANAACTAGVVSFRSIVVAGAGWLGWSVAGGPLSPAESALVMVNWGTERLCVEAVEVVAGTTRANDSEITTTLGARFVPVPRAYRFGFDLGVEYCQPLGCRVAEL